MAAILDSPMIDKLIQNRDAELLKTRHRHAADLAVLDAREHDERLAMTERLGSAMNEVNKAMAERNVSAKSCERCFAKRQVCGQHSTRPARFMRMNCGSPHL